MFAFKKNGCNIIAWEKNGNRGGQRDMWLNHHIFIQIVLLKETKNWDDKNINVMLINDLGAHLLANSKLKLYDIIYPEKPKLNIEQATQAIWQLIKKNKILLNHMLRIKLICQHGIKLVIQSWKAFLG